MVRRVSLIVEGLENKALMSGLSYSLTTDRPTYQVGEPVQMTFTETNSGDQPATIGPPFDLVQFEIDHDGNSIWGNLMSFSPTTVTLQPGQSYSQTMTWDGQTPPTEEGPPTWEPVPINLLGTFDVSAFGDSVTEQQATFQVVAAAPSRRLRYPPVRHPFHRLQPSVLPPPPRARWRTQPLRRPGPAIQGLTALESPTAASRPTRHVLAWTPAPDISTMRSRRRPAPRPDPNRRTSRGRGWTGAARSATEATSRSRSKPRSESP